MSKVFGYHVARTANGRCYWGLFGRHRWLTGHRWFRHGAKVVQKP